MLTPRIAKLFSLLKSHWRLKSELLKKKLEILKCGSDLPQLSKYCLLIAKKLNISVATL